MVTASYRHRPTPSVVRLSLFTVIWMATRATATEE